MCVVCGCSDPGHVHVDGGPAHGHARGDDHRHAPGHAHGHAHGDAHGDRPADAPGDSPIGPGAIGLSVPGMSPARAVKLEADILGVNDRIAALNRRLFASHGVTALNLVSSPGSGKTTLLCATLAAMRARHPRWYPAVIEGDQQTSLDAERIRATGVPAVQVNTGKGCHLDAPMVAEAFDRLHDHFHHATGPDSRRLLFIENVGNLVCPAVWDLGEVAKVVILSVTEGEDKPLKYPDMFAAASLLVLNKIDLLPYLRFDLARCIEAARRVNPAIQVIELSATTGAGLDDWFAWIGRVSAGHGDHAGH